jgi:hypothetical protein
MWVPFAAFIREDLIYRAFARLMVKAVFPKRPAIREQYPRRSFARSGTALNNAQVCNCSWLPPPMA